MYSCRYPNFLPYSLGDPYFPPNPNFAPRPLNIGKSYIFIVYLGSLKLILLDSIKKQAKNLKKGLTYIFKLNSASKPSNIGKSKNLDVFLLIILDSIKKQAKNQD